MTDDLHDWDEADGWPQDDWPYQTGVRRSSVNTLTLGPRAAPGIERCTGPVGSRPAGQRYRERNHDSGPVPYWRTYTHR